MCAPKVSIVVPCRNEISYIEAAVSSILSQDEVVGGFEVLVADGMSTDGTRDVLRRLADEDSRLRVIDNIGLIVPTGLNAAIRASRGEIIVRMDAHTEYASDYVRQCVSVLNETGAHNVGGPWNADGKDFLQRAIAMGFRSIFSSGGAGSHKLKYEGEVDSVYLGCWWKSTLEAVGLFDEEFVRNQDDELNLRLVRAGYRVWQSPRIRSRYFPRNSIGALFRQYRQYGYWKVRVIQKHSLPASARHLVPGAFVSILFLLSVLSIFFNIAAQALGFFVFLYFLASIVAAIDSCYREKYWGSVFVMPLVFFAYHFGYGLGFMSGVGDFLVFKNGANGKFSRLTRG